MGTVAIFDIKRGTVGAALVIFQPKKAPLMRYAYRLSFSSRAASLEGQTEAMLKALRLAAEKLCLEGLPKAIQEDRSCRGIDHVVACVGAPWVSTTFTEKHEVSEKPAAVTASWMRDFIASDETAPEAGEEVLERNAVKILLNGYRTNEPYGKDAVRVDVSVFQATIVENVGDAIRAVFESAFHTDDISLRSSLLGVFTTLRDHFESEDNFLVFNVGSEATEIAFVRDDALVGTAVIERGSHALLQVGNLFVVPDGAGHAINEHLENKAGVEGSSASTELASLESEWQRSIDGALAALKGTQGLPRTVFLLAHPAASSWFSNVLRSQASSAHTLTHEPFRVIELSGDALLRHYHVHADVLPDAPLALETLFLHKVGNLTKMRG